jgi:hypothetical protein
VETFTDEITWFERRAACYFQAQTELRAPTLEAELVEGEHDPAKIAVYHERLERVFERKWRLLMDYPRAPRRTNRRITQQHSVEAPFPCALSFRGAAGGP